VRLRRFLPDRLTIPPVPSSWPRIQNGCGAFPFQCPASGHRTGAEREFVGWFQPARPGRGAVPCPRRRKQVLQSKRMRHIGKTAAGWSASNHSSENIWCEETSHQIFSVGSSARNASGQVNGTVGQGTQKSDQEEPQEEKENRRKRRRRHNQRRSKSQRKRKI